MAEWRPDRREKKLHVNEYAVYSDAGATHHSDRQPNPRDQYHVCRHKLCAAHVGTRKLYFFFWQKPPRDRERETENSPKWDIVCAFNFIARTVDLVLTHSNNALSFDDGEHAPPKNIQKILQKRIHACTLHTSTRPYRI